MNKTTFWNSFPLDCFYVPFEIQFGYRRRNVQFLVDTKQKFSNNKTFPLAKWYCQRNVFRYAWKQFEISNVLCTLHYIK